MSLTQAYKRNHILQVAAASVSAGDAVLVGNFLTGIAITDTDGDGNVEIDLGYEASFHTLSVVGADGSGNAAIAIGDFVYVDGSAVNADDANGVLLGIALGAVASGATTSIVVMLLPGPTA